MAEINLPVIIWLAVVAAVTVLLSISLFREERPRLSGHHKTPVRPRRRA